ncbi:MAG: hypothetical protein JRH05_15500 [Deltaproteobacteria bacterium]|nr:hypothetical protein [Deltaproteobacteria bacterium]MBW2104026.1 hypothetical protein [Deltaproteobacteria bacterium]
MNAGDGVILHPVIKSADPEGKRVRGNRGAKESEIGKDEREKKGWWKRFLERLAKANEENPGARCGH